MVTTFKISRLSVIFTGIIGAMTIVILGNVAPAHAATFTVTNTDADGAGSLYQAITDANAAPDHDTIEFNIPGTGPHTINYLREGVNPSDPDEIGGLPQITTPMTIDGCSQVGSVCAIDSLAPMIEIRGDYTGTIENPAGLSSAAAGFRISNASGVTIRGLTINRITQYQCPPPSIPIPCSSNRTNAVGATNSPNITYEYNIIGTDNVGTPGLGDDNGTSYGLQAADSSNAIIRHNIVGSYYRAIIVAGTTDALVEANIVGTNNENTDAIGTLSSTSTGIYVGINATNTTIKDNLVANYGRGISVATYSSTTQETSHDTLIIGNRVGITPDGSPLGGINVGINTACATGVQIGSLNPGEGNLIANYEGSGVSIASPSNCDAGTHGYIVMGNEIRDNGAAGVSVTDGSGADPFDMTIRRNSIYNNGGLGIDLTTGDFFGDGVTPNAPAGEVRSGPNNLLNYPVITGFEPGSAIVQGNYEGPASQTFTLDFYTNETIDPSGHGEGQTWIGSGEVTTDTSGTAEFTFTFNVDVPEGQFVSATATDADGNTSEFSSNVVMPTYPSPANTPNSPSEDGSLAKTGANMLTPIFASLGMLGLGLVTTIASRHIARKS